MGRIGCIDVGGTAIKAGVLTPDGLTPDGLTHVRQRPTPAAGEGIAARVVDAVAGLVDELAVAAGGLDAVGFVVPGLIDASTGTALWSENLGWSDAPLAPMLAERIGIPVAFGHDVRAGALAEARLGAGAAYRDVVFVPIGTGIASAIVCDGQVFERARPTGEIGHVPVGPDEPCVCGLSGCLEAVASARAISRRYSARSGKAATAAEVVERAGAGDADATAVWEDAVVGLAQAVTWISAVLAPEVIVFGGGLARSGEVLLGPLREEVEKRLSFHHRPVLTTSRFGELAGCVGAGLLAHDAQQERS